MRPAVASFPRLATSALAVGAVVGAIAVLAACGSGSGAGGGGVVTVTVTPSRTTTASPTGTPTRTSGSRSPSTSATPSSSAAPSHLTKFAGGCNDLLPHSAITDALGKELPGADAFVVGQPEKDIGRLAYLNCRYGVTGRGAAAVAKVEIGVSLYTTPTKAAARITATTDDYTVHGATATPITVATLPGQLLTGGSGAGYTEPLLAVASGQRTVAVSIDPSVAAGAAVSKAATTVAALALQRTAG